MVNNIIPVSIALTQLKRPSATTYNLVQKQIVFQHKETTKQIMLV